MERLDPDESDAIVEPALHIMVEAVRRYEGSVVQTPATACPRYSAPLLPVKIIRSARCILPSRCNRRCADIPELCWPKAEGDRVLPVMIHAQTG